MIAQLKVDGSAEWLGKKMDAAKPALDAISCPDHPDSGFSLYVGVEDATGIARIIAMACCPAIVDRIEEIIRCTQPA